MSYVEVCKLGDVEQEGALGVKVDDQPVAVVRTEDDEVFAIEDVCSHGQVALSEGEVDGRTLECWLHGSRFDLRDGRPLCPPATDPVPVFAVRLDGDGDQAAVLVDITRRPTGQETEGS